MATAGRQATGPARLGPARPDREIMAAPLPARRDYRSRRAPRPAPPHWLPTGRGAHREMESAPGMPRGRRAGVVQGGKLPERPARQRPAGSCSRWEAAATPPPSAAGLQLPACLAQHPRPAYPSMQRSPAALGAEAGP